MKRVTTLVLMLVSLAMVFSVSAFAASQTEAKAKPAMTTSSKNAKTSMAAVAQKVNINTAEAADLAKISGIGPKKAEAIIAFRKANGKFKTVDDLQKVKGIGPKILKKIKDKLTI